MRIINRGASDFAWSRTAQFTRSRPSVFARSGWVLKLLELEVQFVDIGLALAAPGDAQEPVGLQRFKVLANVGLVQAHIIGKPFLARIAEVVLPCVAEQHGKREFVT